MQQLHLVGFTTELDGLIFSARRGSKSGGFVVALDERFISLVREAVRLQSGVELLEDDDAEPASGPKAAGERVRSRAAARIAAQVSALSPKEIQARLRAGRSIAEVARDAGVDEDWVMRFASPVLAEQGRIVERALTVACRTSRKGESSEPLSVAVPWNLVDKGLRLAPDELAAGWSAYHARDASWVVRFRYLSRGREHTAQWEFDTAAGSLVSLNRLASELGYIEAGRRRRRFSIVDVLPAERKTARSAAGPETAKPIAKRAVAKKAVAKRVVAKKAVAKKAVAKKAVAKKAVAKKAVATKQKPPTRATADRNGRSSGPVATRPRPADV